MIELKEKEIVKPVGDFNTGDLVKFSYYLDREQLNKKESYSKITRIKIQINDQGLVSFLYVMENGKTAKTTDILSLEKTSDSIPVKKFPQNDFPF